MLLPVNLDFPVTSFWLAWGRSDTMWPLRLGQKKCFTSPDIFGTLILGGACCHVMSTLKPSSCEEAQDNLMAWLGGERQAHGQPPAVPAFPAEVPECEGRTSLGQRASLTFCCLQPSCHLTAITWENTKWEPPGWASLHRTVKTLNYCLRTQGCGVIC